MKHTLALLISVVGTSVFGQTPAPSWPSSNDEIPVASPHDPFTANFDFPSAPPADEVLPWSGLDFKNDPEGYMRAVLMYAMEGMDLDTWDGAQNSVRQWYHAPWMHEGFSGREYINGLTRERASRTGELGPGQSRCYQNWAVSLTNPIGGYTFGRVWGDGSGVPDPLEANFSTGTVFTKLLYTTAPVDEVPLLDGAPSLTANIHDPDNLYYPPNGGDPCPSNRGARIPQEMRLLQFDIAVKHETNEVSTGWIYGTFVYDASMDADNPWDRLRPVGLMWGNDPTLSDSQAQAGMSPSESIVLTNLGLGRDFGRGGRMNGPVDNPESACLSCHQTAQYPQISGMLPPSGAIEEDVLCWFRNLPAGTAFGRPPSATNACGDIPNSGVASLDTSLQLAVGLRNWAFATNRSIEMKAMSAEIAQYEADVAQEALRNWFQQSPRDRSRALHSFLSDAGLLTFQVNRGDPDLEEE